VKKLIEAFYEFRGYLVLKSFRSGLSTDESILLRICNFLSEIHDFILVTWRSWWFIREHPYWFQLWAICKDFGKR